MSAPVARIRVFVADDHAIVREGLVQLLQLQPDLVVVGTCAEGRESLQQIRALLPDVAVLDISMPGLNGIEVAAEIQRLGLPVAVVILSMHSSTEYVFRALEVGARAYLQKESAAAEIVDAIRAVHAGRKYLDTRIAGLVAGHVGDGAARGPLELLSRREREILQLVAQGHSSAQIGKLLSLSPKTVDTYRSRLMQKLGLSDVVSLVKFAIQQGLVSLD
ncbi:response regulator [Caenimonas terrae]|uniref:Response regulator n=1 Tax=Caenimonas terrae TaxID=696074 RepID=A0ABW0NDZ6_9BURK